MESWYHRKWLVSHIMCSLQTFYSVIHDPNGLADSLGFNLNRFCYLQSTTVFLQNHVLFPYFITSAKFVIKSLWCMTYSISRVKYLTMYSLVFVILSIYIKLDKRSAVSVYLSKYGQYNLSTFLCMVSVKVCVYVCVLHFPILHTTAGIVTSIA